MTYKLRAGTAGEMAAILRDVIQGCEIAVDEGSNSLIIHGRDRDLTNVKRLLEKLEGNRAGGERPR